MIQNGEDHHVDLNDDLDMNYYYKHDSDEGPAQEDNEADVSDNTNQDEAP